MLRLWLHCSYFGSSVGFQLGFVDYADGGITASHLVKGEIDPVLERWFYAQSLHSAKGKLPEKNTFIMAEKYPANEKDSNNLVINLAWETDDRDIYKAICAYFQSKHKDDIVSDMSECLIVDNTEASFGLTVSKEKLTALIGSILQTKHTENEAEYFQIGSVTGQSTTIPNKLRLETIYRNKKYKATEISPGLGLYRIEEETPVFAQKKTLILSVVLVIMICCAIFLWVKR